MKLADARIYGGEFIWRVAQGFGGGVMDEEDTQRLNTGVITVGDDLSNLSVAELSERIERLKAEIVRVDAELARKKAHEEAASALFKS